MVAKFAVMMNTMAKRLGLTNTHFMNASGLHHPKQVTTAYDMARLALALKRDYPEYYALFNRTRFSYKGRNYVSHNNVTKRYRGADGLKTGYVRASGFNLITSARRDGTNLVAVVLGGRTAARRDRQMIRLLDQNFYKIMQAKKKNGTLYAQTPLPVYKPVQEFKIASSHLTKPSRNVTEVPEPESGIGSGDMSYVPIAKPFQYSPIPKPQVENDIPMSFMPLIQFKP